MVYNFITLKNKVNLFAKYFYYSPAITYTIILSKDSERKNNLPYLMQLY